MRTTLQTARLSGYSLLLVLLYTGAALMVLCGVIGWSTGKVRLTERQNQYHNAVAVAEAATERVIGRMTQDFQASGYEILDTNLSVYRQLVLSRQDHPILGNYAFSDPSGTPDQVQITKVADWKFGDLESTLSGLKGRVATYSLISAVRNVSDAAGVGTMVEQDVQFASIPVFEFGLFYAMDMEVTPSATLIIGGRVHGNGDIYVSPNQAAVVFQGAITAVKQVLNQRHPLDPTPRTSGSIMYMGERRNGVKSLNLPIGTNNTPSALRAIMEIPPANEPASSPLARQRYYNKADLIILVGDVASVAMSGAYNGFSVTIPWVSVESTGPDSTGFIDKTPSFFNKREGWPVQALDVDIAKLRTNAVYLGSLLGRPLKTLYVADLRTNSASQSGVRLINGEILPSQGFTVATPNPLYIKGHYNAPVAALGTSQTTDTVPASVAGDSITILSAGWQDVNSSGPLTQRVAIDTTINAAMIPGIVVSGGGYASGGVDNAMRFLEDWTGKKFTWNGSLVVLYESRVAVAPWGATAEVYLPPVKSWSYDRNFLDESKLPPSTPELRTIIRTKWTTLAPNAKG